LSRAFVTPVARGAAVVPQELRGDAAFATTRGVPNHHALGRALPR
jgi:hypothetical protein